MVKAEFITANGHRHHIYLRREDGTLSLVAIALDPEAADFLIRAGTFYAKVAGFPCEPCKESYEEPCTVHGFGKT